MNALIWILGGISLAAAIAVIVLIAFFNNGKKGMSGVITGGNSGSYYERNKSTSKEGFINKLTIAACIVFAVSVLALFFAQYDPADETSKNETSKNNTSKTEVSDTSVVDESENVSETEQEASDAVSEDAVSETVSE